MEINACDIFALAWAALATIAGIGLNLRSSFFLKALCSAGVGRQKRLMVEGVKPRKAAPRGHAPLRG
jgi:hypothetical protein